MIITIAGRSGSGKTTVANNLINLLGKDKVSYVHQDSYYKDQSHIPVEKRNKLNFDYPEALELEMLAKHLVQLAQGEIVKQPIYDFVTHTRLNKREAILPKKIIIADGIHLLSTDFIRKISDIKVFVDTDIDICFIWRLLRDIKERGRNLESVVNQYLETVKPMQEKFVSSSIKFADFVIKEGGQNLESLNKLKDMIVRRLNNE